MTQPDNTEQGTPPLLKVSGSLTQVPPWVWGVLVLAGIPISGGAGSMWGAQHTADEVIRLERKLEELSAKQERLDDKIDELKFVIIRAHAQDPGFYVPGGQP